MGIFSTFLVVGITIFFLTFAYNSYYSFEVKVKERLKIFEEYIINSIQREISCEEDNIQSFTNDNEEFNHVPMIFSFPIEVTKIPFPPFEKNPRKQPIIATRKLEFFILSREYFSICKGATTFNLLNPLRGSMSTGCREIRSSGECHEYYYSQIRNIVYDNKKECIRILYKDELDDVEFFCRKVAINRKPVMKALKGKLRLIERQRLFKFLDLKVDDSEELGVLLNNIKSNSNQIDKAIDFDKQDNKAELFSNCIKGSKLSKEGELYNINYTETSVSIDDFFLYFSNGSAEQINEKFKEDGRRVFIIGDDENRESLAVFAQDKTNNIIAPTQKQWSKFLISSKSEEILMEILSECLEQSSISPYQTSKGVKKDMDFFGRINIVRDIKMNSNRNYMIVGGRQLGKSSILKKLERSYAQSSFIDCRFINLEGKQGNIILALAQNFGLEEDSTLEDVYQYINNADKKILLLIDEVDEFVEPEVQNNYKTLKTLKSLSEEGKASFIFAGYWTLYQYIVTDYQSPLYNFGELIVLEGLEKQACEELMVEPMKRIGMTYEDESFLNKVIEVCGQRANLISTVCDEVLKNHKGKIIKNSELQKSMGSNTVRDKLLGWENTDSSNEQNNMLDKIIIYLTVEKNQFEFDEVLELIEKQSLKVGASVVKKSLERLVVSYILKRDGGVFSYRVPLMKEDILKTNEKGRMALLAEVVGKF